MVVIRSEMDRQRIFELEEKVRKAKDIIRMDAYLMILWLVALIVIAIITFPQLPNADEEVTAEINLDRLCKCEFGNQYTFEDTFLDEYDVTCVTGKDKAFVQRTIFARKE